MHRRIAGALTGRVTKWVVLVGALVLFAVMGAFSTRLVDVQNNEASSWLPESAESTKVLEELSATVDPNDIPTLVVYHRDGGLDDDDLAAMEADALEIGGLDGVTDTGVLSPAAAEAAAAQGAPVPTLVSEDGEVAYLYFVLNFGADGWNAIPEVADEIRDLATLDGGEVHLAGFGGQAADSAEAFEGIDTNLIVITLLVVVVLLLITYRSAYLWLPPSSAPSSPTPSPLASSTCWPRTPSSRSTARARRSSASW
jgi:RND superfamily putative drug exporter